MDKKFYHIPSASRILQLKISKVFHRTRFIPFFATLLVTTLLSFFYDGGSRWWVPLVALCLLGILTYQSLLSWWLGTEGTQPRLPRILLLTLLPPLIGLLQLLPLPMFLLRLLSPYATALHQQCAHLLETAPRHIISLASDHTFLYCFLFFTGILLILQLMQAPRHRWTIPWLLESIGGAAAINAMLAHTQQLSQQQVTYSELAGAFMNRNHFAFMMMLGILATIGLIAILTAHPHRYKKNTQYCLMCFLFLQLFLLIISLVLSLSRGGFLAMTAAILFFLVIWFTTGKKYAFAKPQTLIILSVLVCTALAAALPPVMSKLAKRYDTLLEQNITDDARSIVWKATCRTIREYWLTGCGFGAFRHAIQKNAPDSITANLIEHAHNDFLEFAAEIGIPATLCILLILCALWIKAFRCLLHTQSQSRKWGGFACLAALLGAAIHECVDFNLQAWNNYILLVTVLCTLYLCTRESNRSSASKAKITVSEGRWNRRLPILGAAIIFFCLIPFTIRYLWQEYNHAVLISKLDTSEKEALSNLPPDLGNLEQRMMLATAAGYPEKQDALLHWRCARLRLDMAALLPQTEVNTMLQEAWSDISRAIQLQPANGTFYLQAAIQRENGNYLGIFHDTTERQIHFYRQATLLQPTLLSTASIATEAEFRLLTNGKRKLSVGERQRLLAELRRIVHLSPGTADKLLPVMYQIAGNLNTLQKYVPENFQAQKNLVLILIQNHRFPEAEHLTRALRKQKEKQTVQEQMEALQLHLDALSLQGKFRDRLPFFNTYHALHDKQAPVEEITEKIKSGELEKAKQLLAEYGDQPLYSPEYILLRAKQEELLGQTDEIIALLFHLIRGDGRIPPVSILQAALPFTEIKGFRSDLTDRKATLLRCAILIFLHEKRTPATTHALMDAQKLLLDLEGTESLRLSNRWSQQHLIAYFLGKTYLLQGKKELAMAAFQRSLELAPHNALAILELGNLDFQKLSREDQMYHGLLTKWKMPLEFPQQDIACLGIFTLPKKITKAFETVEIEYIFRCDYPLTDSLVIPLKFHDAKGMLFQHDLKFSAGEEMTWPIGQIITRKVGIQPIVEAMKSSTRLPEPGKILLNQRLITFEWRPAASSTTKQK